MGRGPVSPRAGVVLSIRGRPPAILASHLASTLSGATGLFIPNWEHEKCEKRGRNPCGSPHSITCEVLVCINRLLRALFQLACCSNDVTTPPGRDLVACVVAARVMDPIRWELKAPFRAKRAGRLIPSCRSTDHHAEGRACCRQAMDGRPRLQEMTELRITLHNR